MDLALIDFDHTVTTCDSYARFLRRVASPQQLAAAKWSVGPWLAGYRLGLVSAAALRIRVTRLTFAGREAQEMEAAGHCYAEEVLPGLLRPRMMERIAWHRARGDTLVLESETQRPGHTKVTVESPALKDEGELGAERTLAVGAGAHVLSLPAGGEEVQEVGLRSTSPLAFRRW